MTTETERTALVAKLEQALATRIGDAMCDDCGGTLEASGPNGETVPCPDCTPEPPQEVGIDYADLKAIHAALASAPSAPQPTVERLDDVKERAPWPDPTPEMLDGDPRFEAIWQRVKLWDINVPDVYAGYCGATGNHVRAILDALEALSSSAPAEADLAELPDGPCLGPSACNESFGRLLNLLHERGYCETCEGTGTMQAVCGFDPVKGEITTPEVCGECHGVAGKALKIRDFEELRVDVGSRVAVVYGAFSDLNDLCHRFSIAAPSQTPEERPEGGIDVRGVHLRHCNRGENVGRCKYGDDHTCPAMNEPPSWFEGMSEERPAGETPDRGCPCLYTTPCDPACTCVRPESSRGCRRCCRYGSESQRRAMAELLAQPSPLSSSAMGEKQEERTDGTVVCLRKFDPVLKQIVFIPLPDDAQPSPETPATTKAKETPKPRERCESRNPQDFRQQCEFAAGAHALHIFGEYAWQDETLAVKETPHDA
jgi:hypothetical protein